MTTMELPSPPDICHALSIFRAERLYTDVCLKFSQTGRKKFFVHRVILAAASSFFADACKEDVVFSGSWREVMLPPEIDDDTMGLIICWMYNEVPRIELTMDDQQKNWNFVHNLRLAVKILDIKDLLIFLDEHLLTFEESHLSMIVEKKVQNSGSCLEVNSRERSDRITEDVDDSCNNKIHAERPALNHSHVFALPEVSLKQDPDVSEKNRNQIVETDWDETDHKKEPCAKDDEDVSLFSSSRENSSKKSFKVKTKCPLPERNTDLPCSVDNSKKRHNKTNMNISGHKGGNRVRRIECEICSKKISSSNMKRHLKEYHVNDQQRRVNDQQRQSKLACNDPILSPCIRDDVFQCLNCSFSLTQNDIRPRTNNLSQDAGRTTFLVECAKHLSQDHGILCPNICFPCSKCSKIFSNKYSLNKHLSNHDTPADKSVCPICGVELLQNSLNLHIATLHAKTKLPCQICGKILDSEPQLKSHVRYHQKQRRDRCQVCKMFFTDLSQYRHHCYAKHGILKPSGAKVLACPECDYKSPVQSKINVHRKRVHCALPNPVKCPHPGCEKVFKAKLLVTQHYNGVHKAGYSSKCPECDEAFQSKSGLHYHLRRVHQLGHNGNVPNSVAYTIAKPFKCAYCNHTSGLSGNVRKHIKNIHSDLPIKYIDLRKLPVSEGID